MKKYISLLVVFFAGFNVYSAEEVFFRTMFINKEWISKNPAIAYGAGYSVEEKRFHTDMSVSFFGNKFETEGEFMNSGTPDTNVYQAKIAASDKYFLPEATMSYILFQPGKFSLSGGLGLQFFFRYNQSISYDVINGSDFTYENNSLHLHRTDILLFIAAKFNFTPHIFLKAEPNTDFNHAGINVAAGYRF
jgi:hypothetical protein